MRETTANGNKVSQTDARGFVTAMTYDAFYRARITTEPLNKLTTLTRDANGNVESETTTRGGVYGVQIRRKSYDALNRVETATDATGAVARMRYDAVEARGHPSLTIKMPAESLKPLAFPHFSVESA